jgi:hypothetical protein
VANICTDQAKKLVKGDLVSSDIERIIIASRFSAYQNSLLAEKDP